MKTPDTTKKLRKLAAKTLECENLHDFAVLTNIPLHVLNLVALNPEYQVFSIPKRKGGQRLIENPSPMLKRVQRRLNACLQAVYWLHKTDAAYGFITCPVDDDTPRHILSNAQRHRACTWLVNIDLADFFHQVSIDKVKQLLQDAPFRFNEHSAGVISSICTHLDRLPMGAPTSPVLSNFACTFMDQDLLAFCKLHHITYTRYADDLSFSGQSAEIPMDILVQIGQLVENHGFNINLDKIQIYPQNTLKEVTGLCIDQGIVRLNDSFDSNLQQELANLHTVMQTQYRYGRQRSTWTEEYRQRVQGYMAFAQLVLGEQDIKYQQLHRKYRAAVEPPGHFEVMEWFDFPYAF